MSGNRDQRKNWVAAAPFALKNVSVWSWGHSLGSFLETFSSHILKWKKHKTVNTYRNFLQFRKVSPMQIIDWIQACIAMWPTMKTKWQNGGFARSLCPGPFIRLLYIMLAFFRAFWGKSIQHYSSILVAFSRKINFFFYNPCRHNNNVVSLAVVFSIVTQRMWEERYVTILKRLRGRLTTTRLKEANPLSIEEVNSLRTSVCKSMFIVIYTTLKMPLNMEKTGAGSLYSLYSQGNFNEQHKWNV